MEVDYKYTFTFTFAVSSNGLLQVDVRTKKLMVVAGGDKSIAQ